MGGWALPKKGALHASRLIIIPSLSIHRQALSQRHRMAVAPDTAVPRIVGEQPTSSRSGRPIRTSAPPSASPWAGGRLGWAPLQAQAAMITAISVERAHSDLEDRRNGSVIAPPSRRFGGHHPGRHHHQHRRDVAIPRRPAASGHGNRRARPCAEPRASGSESSWPSSGQAGQYGPSGKNSPEHRRWPCRIQPRSRTIAAYCGASAYGLSLATTR